MITDAGAIAARATVLATGGGAALWQRTTNPWGAIGAGAVLAHAAGAELADLELCQFHPTALALPGLRLRRRPDHRGGPRRGRARCSTHRASASRTSSRPATRSPRRSSTGSRPTAPTTSCSTCAISTRRASRTCSTSVARAGLAPEREPVPVAPAAHYLIGGVACDLDGRTTLPGLFAVGECACTGLHGANRLASNSLSECFVFGTRAAHAAVGEPQAGEGPDPPLWRFEPPTAETREAVWRWAGPQRERGSSSGCSTIPTRWRA